MGGPGSGRPKVDPLAKLSIRSVRLPPWLWEYCVLQAGGSRGANRFIRELLIAHAEGRIKELQKKPEIP
jgi:hypothetical protein